MKILTFMGVIIILLLGLNVYQFINIYKYEEEIARLETELEEKPTYIVQDTDDKYEDFYYENYDKLEFYDNSVVFVIDGYGNYYYTYDQMVTVTQGIGEYSYWAYNEEYAIYLGYTKWK